uniref:WH1 domain-containing protein n=1 Tax=Trichuris muris TaxID=70415 RepID=A0A5S6QXE9_TRIMR
MDHVTTRKRFPQNHASLLLSQEENDALFRCLGDNNYTLATAVVQLLSAEPPSRDQWTKKHVGVVCLVKDYSAHGYFLRMYDIVNGFLLWEQFMFDEFYSNRLCDELIAFEGDNCVYGLNFSSTDEAAEFKRALDLKVQALQKRIARKTAQSHGSAAASYGRSNAYTPKFTPVTNMGVVMPSNCGIVVKTKPKNRKHKKRITKEEIGEPTNFEHRVHVGWNPETGYAGHAVTDENEPDIQAILRMVNLPTDFKADKKAVYSVINQFGGVEAVMRDLEHGQRSKVNDHTPSPPPLPSRNHARPKEARQPKPILPVTTQSLLHNNVNRRTECSTNPPPPPPPPLLSSSLRTSPPPSYVEATAHVPPTARTESTNDQPAVSTAAAPPPPPPPLVLFQSDESTPSGQASNARADLLAEIRRGKALKRVDVSPAATGATKKEPQSERTELMNQIAQGVSLKPVDKVQTKTDPAPPTEELNGIAGALARALLERRNQMTAADESSEDDEEDEDDDEEWDD